PLDVLEARVQRVRRDRAKAAQAERLARSRTEQRPVEPIEPARVGRRELPAEQHPFRLEYSQRFEKDPKQRLVLKVPEQMRRDDQVKAAVAERQPRRAG